MSAPIVLPGTGPDMTVGAPVVSVIVLTYNHERYIEAALRSVLSQADAPPHEILVAEDCSPDGTRQVLQRLVEQHPGRFELLPRPRNLGLSANLEDAWKRCRGKYIAILEGDDEWCHTGKLAKVVAALEAHPEWVGCFHAVRQLNQVGRSIPHQLPSPFPERPVEFRDLIRVNLIPTYSCVTYRRGLVTEFPPWHRNLVCGDWGLNMLHAQHGPFGFLPEVMTQYRAHPRGLWSGMGDVHRWHQSMQFWAAVDAHFEGQYKPEIDAAIAAFLQGCQATLDDLRKVERRYRLLQLHHVAAGVRRMKLAALRFLALFKSRR